MTSCNGSKVLVGSKNSTWESFNGGNSFRKISVAGYSYAMSCDGAPMYAASRDGPMWKSNGFAWGVFESSQGWGSVACNKRCDATIALDRNGRLWKSPSINRVVLLRVSGSHSCAILDSGKVKCWGENPYGQLGLGDKKSRGDKPNQMGTSLMYVGIESTVVQLRLGSFHTCAQLDNGKVKCWGYNHYGQLGYGDIKHRGDDSNEMGDNLPYVDVGGTVVQIELGQSHTCALLDNGKVKCWGNSFYGQLGYGDKNNKGDNSNEMGDNLPYVDVGGTVVQLELGYEHTCALLDNGKVKCWGHNNFGQLGVGDANNSL